MYKMVFEIEDLELSKLIIDTIEKYNNKGTTRKDTVVMEEDLEDDFQFNNISNIKKRTPPPPPARPSSPSIPSTTVNKEEKNGMEKNDFIKEMCLYIKDNKEIVNSVLLSFNYKNINSVKSDDYSKICDTIKSKTEKVSV